MSDFFSVSDPFFSQNHWLKLSTNDFVKKMGPVVKSIMSLAKLLFNDLLSLLGHIKSSVLIFFDEKLEKLLHCKSFSHFSAKKCRVFNTIHLKKKSNISLTNDLAKFQ